jgi:hypothetical protein
MTIQGVITSHDVLRHPLLIASSFGLGTYFRCCKALLRGERTTFLQCVFPEIRRPRRPIRYR